MVIIHLVYMAKEFNYIFSYAQGGLESIVKKWI